MMMNRLLASNWHEVSRHRFVALSINSSFTPLLTRAVHNNIKSKAVESFVDIDCIQAAPSRDSVVVRLGEKRTLGDKIQTDVADIYGFSKSSSKENRSGIQGYQRYLVRDGNMKHANKPRRVFNQNRFPIGEFRQSRLPHGDSMDMEVVFVGTASCTPTLSRGVSCIALKHNGNGYLFDCGEATSLKIQSSQCHLGDIKKIFITHLHGDHCFGLPAILCSLGQINSLRCDQSSDTGTIIDIYGPQGLADYIRATLQLSYSKIAIPYRVHEIMNVPYLHSSDRRFSSSERPVKTSFNSKYGEQTGGQRIYPNKNGVYDVCIDEHLSVTAAPLQHTVPCVGYVVTEKTKPGTILIDKITPHQMRNKAALDALAELEFNHRKLPRVLKELPHDGSYTLPDGTVLYAKDFLLPPIVGRKVVFLGDTCNSDMIAPLAMDADLLIHEATNAHIPDSMYGGNFMQNNSGRHDDYRSQEREAIERGHSTPQMAGRFAKSIRAKQLALTHFSPRYSGFDDVTSMRVMWAIENQARELVGDSLKGENDVVAAWDTMRLGIPRVGGPRNLQ